MRCSTKRGFLATSAWPYHCTKGISFEDDKAVGAEVAVIPNGFAGEEVGIGESIGHAESVPGIVKPP
jgi:hypothetical protein